MAQTVNLPETPVKVLPECHSSLPISQHPNRIALVIRRHHQKGTARSDAYRNIRLDDEPGIWTECDLVRKQDKGVSELIMEACLASKLINLSECLSLLVVVGNRHVPFSIDSALRVKLNHCKMNLLRRLVFVNKIVNEGICPGVL